MAVSNWLHVASAFLFNHLCIKFLQHSSESLQKLLKTISSSG